MQVVEVPIVAEQSEQFPQPEKLNESALIAISTQVSFEALLNVIQALPTSQKWQIYQALGLELATQSAEAKAIARLADEDDESKWITVVEEDEEIDIESSLEYLKQRGYKVEISAQVA